MISPVLEVLILGVIQGLTEFLPISSDGHLALAQLLFHTSESSLTVTVMLHAGTFLATLLVLRHPVFAAVKDGFGLVRRPALVKESQGARDALAVIVASIPTAAIGLSFRDRVEFLSSSPLAIALGFLATGALLVSSRFVKPGEREHPTLLQAFLIGTAQGIAVLPGVSRSASTIVLALWLGVRPVRAFELSMLLSLPAVLGAILLEGRHIGEVPEGVPLVVLGAVVAFGVGVLALNLLRKTLIRGLFPLFALWVIPLGLATLAFAYALPAR
jgi:undecaprenyl-diphosphatase